MIVPITGYLSWNAYKCVDNNMQDHWPLVVHTMTVYVFKGRDLWLTRPHKTRHPVGKPLNSYVGKVQAHNHQQVNIDSHITIYHDNYHTCHNTHIQSYNHVTRFLILPRGLHCITGCLNMLRDSNIHYGAQNTWLVTKEYDWPNFMGMALPFAWTSIQMEYPFALQACEWVTHSRVCRLLVFLTRKPR